MTTTHRLMLLTPLFSRGSYEDRPEVRPPSIRGQLHWWFRALGGSHADEKAIFGGVHGGASASRIVVRVSGIEGDTGDAQTLPHKHGNQASPKAAWLRGTRFDLHLVERLGGLDAHLAPAFRRCLEAWLLAGTLGLRATRAGGSFVWAPADATGIPMPETPADYAARLAEIFEGTPLRAALLDREFRDPETARRCVSDTIGGRDDNQGESDLARLHHPLGKVFGGRKTSPLRFRIVQVGDSFRIVAIWDGRSAVTGNSPNDLNAVIDLLERKGKEVGQALRGAF